jgi:hypothetical protein
MFYKYKTFSYLLLMMVCLFAAASSFSQQQFDRLNFDAVDSLARSIPYKNDVYELTRVLTAPYTTDIYKVRSIFVWITAHISYDYKFINKGRPLKAPGNEFDYIKTVLKKGRAICDGYSKVFKEMCTIAGITSEVIPGYTKSKPYQIGTGLSVNHAWNSVLLDSVYYYLDPTWAAGYCTIDEETEKLLSYTKAYENYYWLTPFSLLKRNHYPESGRWIPEPGFTKEKFAASPYISNEIIPYIELNTPKTGIITAVKGDTIHIDFSYTKDLRVIQVNSSLFRNPNVITKLRPGRKSSPWVIDSVALRMQRYVAVNKRGQRYSFDFAVTDNSLYYLDILFDFKQVMRFKVIQPQ